MMTSFKKTTIVLLERTEEHIVDKRTGSFCERVKDVAVLKMTFLTGRTSTCCGGFLRFYFFSSPGHWTFLYP